MLSPNLVNIITVAVIAVVAYVVVFGGLKAAGLSLPYVNS